MQYCIYQDDEMGIYREERFIVRGSLGLFPVSSGFCVCWRGREGDRGGL